MSGVSIASGSPLLIAVSTAMKSDEEYQGIHEAGTNKAALEDYYGTMAAYTGTVGGIGSFLSGLQKSGMMYSMSQKGVSPYVNPSTMWG
jgi:hypothetical protein